MLTTKRLLLTILTDQDYELIHAVQSIPAVDEYNTLGVPKSLAETIEIMRPLIENKTTAFTYGVRLHGSNEFIGLCAINLSRPKYQAAELWYKFNPDFWGKGYATEVVTALIDHCFNFLNLHRVEAGCAVENIGSVKVLEKVGMIREGRKRKTLPLKSGWSDNYEYGILNEEWQH